MANSISVLAATTARSMSVFARRRAIENGAIRHRHGRRHVGDVDRLNGGLTKVLVDLAIVSMAATTAAILAGRVDPTKTVNISTNTRALSM